MHPYRVYVLRNSAGKFYIGFSENVTLRIQQRNIGMTRSTRGKGHWLGKVMFSRWQMLEALSVI